MKKLFFTALVAIVAVGGALSTNANPFYLQDGTEINCETTAITTCASVTLYDAPSAPRNIVSAPSGTKYNP